jgi:hypothetical protein
MYKKLEPLVKTCKMKLMLDLHDGLPATTEPGCRSAKDDRRSRGATGQLPRDFGLGGEKREKTSVKTLLTRSLVDPAVASRKPHPKVVAASPVATFLLVQVPRHLKGEWGDQEYHIEKAAATSKSFLGHFHGFFLLSSTRVHVWKI